MAVCFLATATLPLLLVKSDAATAKSPMLSLVLQIRIHECSSDAGKVRLICTGKILASHQSVKDMLIK
jgi:hypothetical protein